MPVEGHRGLDRSDDPLDRHHRLNARSGASCALMLEPPYTRRCRAGDDRHLTQHWQAVAAGWTAVQPSGQFGEVRLPPGAVEIIPGVLVSQSGAHGRDPENSLCLAWEPGWPGGVTHGTGLTRVGPRSGVGILNDVCQRLSVQVAFRLVGDEPAR